MSASKKTLRLAKKMGMMKSSRSGHGGARGNGNHLKANAKDTSENARRNENKVTKAMNRDLAGMSRMASE